MIRKEYLKEKDEGKEYYAYYLQLTNRGNRYYKKTGIYKVRFKSRDEFRFKFDILETTYKNLEALQYIINAFHAQSTNELYTTKEEAIKAHDKEILNQSKACKNSTDRLKMLSLMVNSKTTDELATEWYKNLSSKEKEFIEIIINGKNKKS